MNNVDENTLLHLADRCIAIKLLQLNVNTEEESLKLFVDQHFGLRAVQGVKLC